MKVIAINGSPRKDGNTSILLNKVLEELKAEGIETEIIQLGGTKLKGCTACKKCFELKNNKCIMNDDALNEIFAKVKDADGILLGSPVYFADITPEIKAFMDRGGFVSMANGRSLTRKVGAAVVAVRRAGAIHAFDSLNHFFLINQMIIPGSSYWNIGIGMEKGDVESDKEGMKTMSVLGKNMAWLLKKIQ